ncbi:hypothetical protein EVAR_82310_1 [Eumeta japonica]|uniref:Uncharacterized protein n=1 Tax=Eumeta variegata TaxID=151549 RepID=A0A4C1W197_EUMVA|nr:hypothetical protein EVAR_82310_1 [Eumeta japonica]
MNFGVAEMNENRTRGTPGARGRGVPRSSRRASVRRIAALTRRDSRTDREAPGIKAIHLALTIFTSLTPFDGPRIAKKRYENRASRR